MNDLERIADAFEMIAKLLAQWYDQAYPPKHEPRDVTLTHIPTDIERVKEAQGASEETTDEWLDIGRREREFLESPPAPETRRAPRRVAKASRVSPIKSK